MKERCEGCSRAPLIRACSNLMCIYFESIEIAIHSILTLCLSELSELRVATRGPSRVVYMFILYYFNL